MQGTDLPILSERQVLHDIEAEAEGMQILQKERGKTMAEYINREDLLNNLKQFAPELLTPLIVMLIEKQPTADLVEVVRCRDCKYWDKVKNPKHAGKGICISPNKSIGGYCTRKGATLENDYCSLGARMDGMDGDTE